MIAPVIISDGKIVISIMRDHFFARAIGPGGDIYRSLSFTKWPDLYAVPLKDLHQEALEFYQQLKAEMHDRGEQNGR
jgi:hypothetical protein